MTVILHTYANGFVRGLTVLTVTTGDVEDTAIATTAEEGNIVLSLFDAPDLWAQLQTAGFV